MNKRYKTIRRVIITGQMSEIQEAGEWAYKNGYWLMRSGPMPAANHRVDPTRFKIVAEKEID